MSRVGGEIISSDQFLQPPGFDQQYANVYYLRLDRLGREVEAQHTWKAPRVERVLDLVPGSEAWFVGTVIRDMGKRPDVIEDIKLVNHGISPKMPETYASAGDTLYIEDNHGRVEIEGGLTIMPDLVTGIVIGVLGTQDGQGVFHVTDITLPRPLDLPPSICPPTSRKHRKIAIISGLLFDSKIHEGVSIQLLIDFLSGSLLSPQLIELASQTERLIIAGDSLVAPEPELVGSRIMRPNTSMAALTAFDAVLSQIATYLPVHLMPGRQDPAPAMLPQQPLHPALLGARSRSHVRSGRVRLEPNPQIFTTEEGITILGSSGQPLADLHRYAPGSDIDLMERALQWHHIAPTAPDTYWTYPFVTKDPLVIESAPHVYFSANADSFHSEVRSNTRLISVPRFAETGTVVMLDMDTLDATTLTLAA